MIVIIPARGGSKGIPKKNLTKVGGVSLVERSIKAGLNAKCVSRVVVSTDDSEIMKLSEDSGAEVIIRPEGISGDIIMPDAAVLHALNTIQSSGGQLSDVTCFIQPTSPFTTSNDIDFSYENFCQANCDSMFSGVLTHSFLWKKIDESEYVKSVNHDSAYRLGRQQLEPQFSETGAFYMFKTQEFLRVGHRFFGNIGVYEIPAQRAIDVDNFHDLELAEFFENKIQERNK